MWETWVQSLGWEDHLATQSSILAWRIPWTEEPGGLQFMGSQRVGHDWATSLTYKIIKLPFIRCQQMSWGRHWAKYLLYIFQFRRTLRWVRAALLWTLTASFHIMSTTTLWDHYYYYVPFHRHKRLIKPIILISSKTGLSDPSLYTLSTTF